MGEAWLRQEKFYTIASMNAIEIKQLRKSYPGGVDALKGIDLSIKKGEFFGLLGPNGAGKSTTIGILCSLIQKTSGSAKIFNHEVSDNPFEAKRHLGVVPQEFNFNIFEPCSQIVINQGGYYGLKRAEAVKRAKVLFEQLGLEKKYNVPSMALSGGMKRRLMIARSLIHQPDILILDEPTAGVDISLRRSMWTFLQEQNKQGLTIILTTHYLEEAESLCEKIAIIDEGTIIEQGRTAKLLEKLNVEAVILYCDPFTSAPKVKDIKVLKVDDTTLEVELTQSQTVSEVLDVLAKKGIRVNRFRNKANRLEELFINLVSPEG